MSIEKQISIEKSINDVITTKLEEGIIEKLVAENLEKCINKALENLTGNYGDVTKVIQEKIKAVMIEQLESYDYSEYIVKLDTVLTEILKHTALDHKKMLDNFKALMTDRELPKTIKLTDIFEEFKKHVAKDVDTDDLEVDTDDRPRYEYVSVTMDVEYEDKRPWSSFQNARVIFECEKDEKLNYEILLSKFDKYPWHVSVNIDTSIKSLRHLDEFKIYLLKLDQNRVDIEIDVNFLEDEVKPEAEPEATFS
ncbi:MAG: hypothetical protein A4E56_00162 [Pelotomaculum sp. PtaU1.Bin065]|nr:MAG: hypothetical protein A4E56_00162 [Pelotomaculum sp. PtaU1.Bin065]